MEDVKEKVVVELQRAAGEVFNAMQSLPKRQENMETLRRIEAAWRAIRDLAETLTIREVEL